MKTLYFSTPPKDANPSESLCAGPWCFADQEDLFPDFATRFTFLREPLTRPEEIQKAIVQTRALVCTLLPKIAAELAPMDLPANYWQTLLMPWLALICEQIVERAQRVQILLQDWQEEEVLLPLLPWRECRFAFNTESDVTLQGALNVPFNFWLFSWLLSHQRLPACWRIKTLNPITQQTEQAQPSLRERLRNHVRSVMRFLPMPNLKGMSPAQSLLFSAALLHKAHGQDNSYLLTASEDDCAMLSELNLPDPMPILRMTLPRSIRELKHPAKIKPSKLPRFRCASIAAYEDSRYRQRLALFRAQGNRLCFVQHGGNYGQVRFACVTAWVEYAQAAFLTWGWTTHGSEQGTFIPLPYPQLAKIKNAWQGRSEDILFVGTEMPLFGYRLDAHPTPMQIVAYRDAKVRLLENLPQDILAKMLYRPYFKVPSTLNDWEYIESRFPLIRLCRGPLNRILLDCRLLILDHHGTTLLEAMAANIPLILCWNPSHWPMTAETENLLARLGAAGIFFSDPRAAAEKIREIFPDPKTWWMGDQIQALRKEFCTHYARIIPGSENRIWFETLRAL